MRRRIRNQTIAAAGLLVLAGGGAGDVLLPAFVTLGMGIVFFAVGALVFRRRFA